jgi:hypothetical protein
LPDINGKSFRWGSHPSGDVFKNRKVGALAFDESRLLGESHPTGMSMR